MNIEATQSVEQAECGFAMSVIAGERRRRTWKLCASLVLALAVLATGDVAAAPAANVLPDGRALELVSPPDKHGASIDPLGFGVGGLVGGLVVAGENGGSITYVADGPVTTNPEGNRAIEGNQVLSRRTPQGWVSQDIVTPHDKGEGFAPGPGQEYKFFSSDLAFGLAEPFTNFNPMQEPPLVAGLSSEELSIYRRHNLVCEEEPSSCYEAVVNPANDTAGHSYGSKVEFSGASADLKHIVFEAEVPLTPTAPAGGGLYEWSAEAPAESQVQFIGSLPALPGKKARPAASAELGNNNESVTRGARNAVSTDGSRVFFGARPTEASEIRNLYLHELGSDRTVRVNAQEGFKPVGLKGEVHYQTASADGSRVFFTDTSGLTADSVLKGKEAGPADLYVCEVAPGEGTECPAGKLTDLTGTTAGFASGGDIVGVVLGASETGSVVYFVANGAQSGGTEGTCPNPNSQLSPTLQEQTEEHCNLYVARNQGSGWEAPKLIGELSGADGPDWALAGTRLWNLTARVSPQGNYLAFMSERPLTGYDNRDASPAAKEARDEEVFLYNLGTEHVTCPSCNPDPTKRPLGVFDTEVSGEGDGLLMDPLSKVWSERWLAASIPPWTALSTLDAPVDSRFLLDNGRLFFNSADQLVAQDENERSETIPGASEQAQVGLTDVYEQEPEGLGSCAPGSGACLSLLSSGTSDRESAFLEASTTGDEAFFLTSQALVPADRDAVPDVYDARVCTELSPCITPAAPPTAPCTSEASCRPGAGSGTPGFGNATSETALATSIAPRQQTLPAKEAEKAKAKPLTRAQKLKRALAACRKAHKHAKRKRVACERQAHKRYGSRHHKAAKR